MPYAVELFLDRTSTELVCEVWRELQKAGVSSYLAQSGTRPHITLAVFGSVDIGALQAHIEALAGQLSPTEVGLNGLGIFPGDRDSLYLAVTVTGDLLRLHTCSHELLSSACSLPDPYYLPGHWVPHCATAVDVNPALTPKAVEVCRQMELPRKATIEQIGVVEFRPVRHLFCYPLSGGMPV